jgi:DNA-binding Lrp family transcriptional regulator
MLPKQKAGEEALKDTELKIISELMKNSRRSDRELAKAIGASQPTVSRIIKKLEKEKTIEEYTMIPNFGKLGYKILALTFVRLKTTLNQEQIERAREITKAKLRAGPSEVVMLERGIGLGFDGVFITYHEDYSSYEKFADWLRQFDFLAIEDVQSFIVNLESPVRYRPLTFSVIANHVREMKEKKE